MVRLSKEWLFVAFSRYRRGIAIAYCFAWISLPVWVLTWEFAKKGNYAELVATLVVSFGALLIPSVWCRTLRAYLFSMVPLAILSAFVSMYGLLYASPVTAGLIQSIVYADMRVELEGSSRFWGIGLATLFGTILFVRGAVSAGAQPFPYRKIAIAVSLWTIAVLIYLPYVAEWAWQKYDLSLRERIVKNAYPPSLVYAGLEAWQASRLLQAEDRTDIARRYGLSPPVSNSSKREVYVFILGEGARESTWTELENPALGYVNNLIHYRDALSQANWSRLSVPMIMSGARIREDVSRLPTLTDWERWAGCKTIVLSNSSSYRFTRGADIKTVLGEEGIIRYNGHDHDLLPEVANLLARKGWPKLCITLHMVGSHQTYKERYDRKFAKFDVGANDGRLRLANDYRNTIVMTQDFVRRVIELLGRDAGNVFVAYTADHGENLLEINDLKEHVTLTPTEYELKVPVLFWANDNFLRAHADSWRMLRANASAAITNGNLLPTVLDAMGVLPEAMNVYDYDASLMQPLRPKDRFYYSPDLQRHPQSDMLVDGQGNIPNASSGYGATTALPN